MKWNWGHGIVLSFVLFCTFIIYIVVRAFQLDVDLVSETYYKDELAFQDRIDQRANLASSGLEVTMKQSGEDILITFPEQFAGATGVIHFYHPSREIFDKRYDILLTENHQQSIAKEELIKGRFKVKMEWVVNDTPYFQESEIFLR